MLPIPVTAAANPAEVELALALALASKCVATLPVGVGFSPTKPLKCVHSALKSEAFLQPWPSVALLPATKLTGAHCHSMSAVGHEGSKSAHLVENAVRRVVDDLDDARFAGEGVHRAHVVQTEVADAGSVDQRHDLFKGVGRFGVRGRTEAPLANRVDLPRHVSPSACRPSAYTA